MAELLIAAPEDFVPALAPFRDFKTSTGIAAELISLEAICSAFAGRDPAEKVKRCLEHWVRRTGTKYALLVGDNSRFPVRYTKHESKDPDIWNISYGPADLYYADLFRTDGSFDDWDRNGNGYFGELRGDWTGGTLNVDEVDLRPDIAVGRVPAHSPEEVQRYVDKAISYESGLPQPWAKEALLIATTSWVESACTVTDTIAAQYLQGYRVHRLYSSGNSSGVSTPPTPSEISRYFNQGVGLVCYMGHGSKNGWAETYDGDLLSLHDLALLNNDGRLPVVVSIACDTSWFARQPPYDDYVDVNGVSHTGTIHAGTFSAPPPIPACLQPSPEVDTFGVDILVERGSGAIAHLGCITGAQPYAMDLGKYFFEGVSQRLTTLGDLWKHMVTRYYETHVPPLIVDPPDWGKVADFHQPWKFFLLGDPSLRLWGLGKPGSILQIQGRLSFLRVHEAGTRYGPHDDEIDGEVIVGFQNAPGRGFGFQLRPDGGEESHRGMLGLLRRAFTAGNTVQIDFVRTGFLNGRIMRVRILPEA
jgi:hypothetical protein